MSTVTIDTSKKIGQGTYPLTLTGVYGSGNPATGGLTHSTTVDLKVR